jgi:hypothetical protein
MTLKAALCVTIAIAALAASCVQASSRKFETHPHIRCSACNAVAEAIGDKMNETGKIKTSFKAGHRLNKDNNLDYEASELRAIEIMEKVCGDLSKYELREGRDGVRLLSKDTGLKHPKFYGKADREELDNVQARLKDFCHGMLDEHDEAIVKAIRSERQLNGLQERLCVAAVKACGTTKADKGRKAEIAKYDKAEAKRKKEEEDRRAEDEAEKAKKAAQDAAPKAEGEVPPLSASATPEAAATAAGGVTFTPPPGFDIVDL